MADPAAPRGAWLALALWVGLPSAGFVQKYAGLAGVAVYLAAVLTVCYLLWRWADLWLPQVRRRYAVFAALTCGGLAAAFVTLHPLEDGRGIGRSSDRDDGLNLAVERLADGMTPYYPPHHFAGPLSVLPGAVFLAAPFAILGNSGYQNLFWLMVFAWVAGRAYRDPAKGLVWLVAALAVSPAALYEYISGGDLIANGIYVAVFFWLTLRTWLVSPAPAWQRAAAVVLLGTGLASRPNFLLLLPLMAVVIWRGAGFRRGLQAAGLAGATALAVTLPFYWHDPAGFTPLLVRHKLAVVDATLPWASTAMLAATVATCIAGAWLMLRNGPAADVARFYRWCTWVTLCPMVAAMICMSVVNGGVDLSFLRDRFGLMFVFFALLGWGGCPNLQPSPRAR